MRTNVVEIWQTYRGEPLSVAVSPRIDLETTLADALARCRSAWGDPHQATAVLVAGLLAVGGHASVPARVVLGRVPDRNEAMYLAIVDFPSGTVLLGEDAGSLRASSFKKLVRRAAVPA